MLDDLPQVQRDYDDLKERLAKARGRYEESMARIKKDFGRKTLDAAEALLEEKKTERQQAATVYLKKMKRFKKELARVKEKLRGPE